MTIVYDVYWVYMRKIICDCKSVNNYIRGINYDRKEQYIYFIVLTVLFYLFNIPTRVFEWFFMLFLPVSF